MFLILIFHQSYDVDDNSLSEVHLYLIRCVNFALGVSSEVVENAILMPSNYEICDAFVKAKDPKMGALFIGIPSLGDHCELG